MSLNINNSLINNKNVQWIGYGIRLPFGTDFRLIKVSNNGSKSLINLKPMNGSISSVFLALFDEEDIEFRVFVDNRWNSRGIGFSINLDNHCSRIYVRPHTCLPFDSFTAALKKLCVKSQTSDVGKQCLSTITRINGITHQKASIYCSRITFNVEVEVEKEVKLFETPFDQNLNRVIISGDEIQLFVMTSELKAFPINIGINNTIEELKQIIYQTKGIPLELQKFQICGNILENSRTVGEYNIKNKSTLMLMTNILLNSFSKFVKFNKSENVCTRALPECVGNEIQVFVRTLRAKTITINIGTNNTIEDLKLIVFDREGIPSDRFRLLSQGKHLENSKTIFESNIENESVVHLVQWLRGGANAYPSRLRDGHEYGFSLSDLDSDEEESEDESDDDEEEEENTKVISSERGVIRLGKRSEQKMALYRDFEPDINYPIYSFTIEFHLNSK